MGKLIRNGIEYGGGNGTDIFEVTQAEYDALVQACTLVHNALYVITDAPNLNATASDIEYSSGVTVADKLDDTYTKSEVDTKVPKSFLLTISSTTSDSGISPFNYYGQGSKTDANIHNILAVSVYDVQFNNPSIAVFYGQNGTTFTFMAYSARSGNVRIVVMYD